MVGIFLGILMGRSKTVAGLLDPLFSGTYAVPKLALFPIFIFVFGIGSLSKVALVFLECLYPIVIMSYAGARSVHRVYLWSAQNMGASRADILRRVVIPALVEFSGDRIRASGKFEFDRDDFNVKTKAIKWGTIRVDDDMKL